MAQPQQPAGGGQGRAPRLKYTTTTFDAIRKNTAVLPANYDYSKALQRAMKVFIMSYLEIDNNSPQIEKDKFNEFALSMARLFINTATPDMSFLNQLYQQIPNEEFRIHILCKRMRGGANLTKPSLVATFRGIKQKVIKKALDISKEEQPYTPMRITLNFNEFKSFRKNFNNKIVFTIEDPGPLSQQLAEFELIFRDTHPEGYEEWVNFGNGVQLLICVENKVRDEPNVTEEEVSNFHLRSLERIIKAKMEANENRTSWTNLGHFDIARKFRVSYQRPYVDHPQTDDKFWTEPKYGRPPSRQPSDIHITPRRDETVVKFIDLQIAFETTEDFEDSVCLCNEWCNWNAFFYYNPIYRFLIVRHRQLYLKNMSNLPEMYLCLSVIYGCCNPQKTPVLRIMNCANEYRKRFYDNYFLKSLRSQTFQQMYQNSRPLGQLMIALSYNKLRFRLKIIPLCYSLNPNPFSDICIENLFFYYNVLIDLHRALSQNNNYITDQQKWGKEADVLGRYKYKEYLKESYDKCMAEVPGGYDYLFTPDYEYTSKIAPTDELQAIRDIRDSIMRKVVNPFNRRITLNKFLGTFTSIYKIMARVEHILPGVHKQKTKKQVMDAYVEMDKDFEAYRAGNTSNFLLSSMSTDYNHLQQNFEVFYTLKLYFYAFEIQRHCINSVLKNNELMLKDIQTCDKLHFVWNNSIVEQRYRTVYQGQTLFQINDIKPVFDEFYEQFWGRPAHEANLQIIDLLQSIRSAKHEYQRLYFWLRNDGNNKTIFSRIIQTFNDSFSHIRQRSDQILEDLIIPGLAYLYPNYEYSAEVFDHLVYYLVKANCFVILSTTANLFQSMHGLQITQLVTNKQSYSLCKPGWIPLFKTLNDVRTAIDDFLEDYIAFDDEFDRISNTCLQTRRMIKEIYRQFYEKLTFEWLREFDDLFTCLFGRPQATELIVMHLVVGLAFAAVFVNDFREIFMENRKKLFAKLTVPVNPRMTQQVQFTQCINVVRDYLSDRQIIDAAMPFDANIWRQHLNQQFVQLDQLNGQQLNIDLNAANI